MHTPRFTTNCINTLFLCPVRKKKQMCSAYRRKISGVYQRMSIRGCKESKQQFLAREIHCVNRYCYKNKKLYYNFVLIVKKKKIVIQDFESLIILANINSSIDFNKIDFYYMFIKIRYRE